MSWLDWVPAVRWLKKVFAAGLLLWNARMGACRKAVREKLVDASLNGCATRSVNVDMLVMLLRCYCRSAVMDVVMFKYDPEKWRRRLSLELMTE